MNPQSLRRSIYPFLGVMVIVAMWQLYTSLSGISPLVLPSPMEIASVWLSALGILLFAAVAVVERLTMPWERAAQH
jgi:ABC-type nitrate/sulfonate/bicarbonate transport system permease component